MNYKVLYRKYRPSTFAGIVGQDYTVEMLQNAIIHNKISHAYLFTGPRGTGKTSTAKIFAKTINCLNPVNGEACGQCASCLSFSESPDIIEIDAASNNGVDDIRELINNVKIAPTEGKYKIYIIDEVHMMTTSAFNALLLTLEEPPKHAIFIMATTNVENVPITILSRCQRFNFQKISTENLKKQIQFVCNEENIKITEDAILEIAYLSEGGMRDALSLLDQLSSNSEEITLDMILSHYGSISSKLIKEIIEMVEKKEVEKLENVFMELENSSSDYKIFIKKLVNELVKIATYIKMNRYDGDFSYRQIKKIIFDLNDILNKANIHMNPYVLIKLALLDYEEEPMDSKKPMIVFAKKEEPSVEIKNQDEKHEIVKKQEQQELNEIKNKYLDELKKIRINNCFVEAKKEVLNEYQNIWKNLATNENIKPDFISYIVDSSIVASSKNYCIICSKLESIANLINTRLEEFTDEIQHYFNSEIHFIALTKTEWDKERNQYIHNLKENEHYQMINEETIQDLKPKEKEKNENVVSDVFNCDKIEIV